MNRHFSVDKHIAVLIFIVLSSVYFATISGITSSNDGSHYALVRALVDDRSFRIDPYLSFTENQDYATRDGQYYSDRPPGTALLSAPLYALGYIGPIPLVDVPSKHDAGHAQVIYAVLGAALSAALAMTLFYLLLRHVFDVSIRAAALATLALALGTTIWKYGTVLYSHAASALVLTVALYGALRAIRTESLRLRDALLLGFVLGFAPLVEYTNVPFVVIVGLYLLLARLPRNTGTIRWWSVLVGAALVPVAFLLVYNTVNFGGPLEFSRFYADTILWPENENLSATFTTPLLYGLQALLWFVPDDPNQGLFLLSPIALIGLFGWLIALKRHTSAASFIFALFVLYLGLFATSTTFNPLTNDGRYITSVLPLWFIGVAFGISWVFEQRNQWVRAAGIMITCGLLFVSIQQQFRHIAFSWNYDLTPDMLAPLAASPSNILLIWGTVFPNIANVPLLWAGYGIVALGFILLKRRQSVAHTPDQQVRQLF